MCSLSSSVVKENSAAGTVVGTLLAVDPNPGDTATFTLVNDASGRFAISGNKLVVASGASLDYETATSHTIVVRATDSGGLTLDKTLVITVQNVNEVVGFDVQHGATERSYIRYVDLVFESGCGSQLSSSPKAGFTSRGLERAASNPVGVSLAGKLKVVGNHVTADFGKRHRRQPQFGRRQRLLSLHRRCRPKRQATKRSGPSIASWATPTAIAS